MQNIAGNERIIDVEGESSRRRGESRRGTNKGLKSWESASGGVGSEVMTLIRVPLEAAAAAAAAASGGSG